MVRLNTCRSSRWLANLFDTINRQLEGKVLVTFDNSFIAQFNGIGLVHFTSVEENLSPFSFAVKDLNISLIPEGGSIIYFDNCFMLNGHTIRYDEDIFTYNESEIKPIDSSLLLGIPDIDQSSFYSEKFNYIRTRLLENHTSDRLSDVVINILSLLGLGEGLTPSGDDYITGFLYGLYLTNNTTLINKINEILLANISESTTLISETFIRHALKGRFSLNIVKHDWVNLLTYGHTSGYFTYLGILDSTQAMKLNFHY